MRVRLPQTRVARALALLWLASLPVMFAVGFGWAVVSMWKSHVSTPHPTEVNAVPYVSHGTTLFAPANLVRWHDRLDAAYPALLLTFVALTVVTWVVAARSDAIGRRWNK
jgi:hypothetical protein